MTSVMTFLPVIIAIVVVIPTLLFVVRLMKGLDAGQKDIAQLMQTGAMAQGRVVQVQMGSMTVTTGAHRNLELQITVDVYPQGGGQYRQQQQPWRAQITQLVSELQVAQLQPGATVEIRYDAQNPQRAVVAGIQGPAGMQRMMVSQVPQGAKIGMAIGIIGAIVGIGAAVVASVSASRAFDDIPSASADEDEDEDEKDEDDGDDEKKSKKKKKKKSGGDEDAGGKHEVCVKADKCCRKVFEGMGTAAEKSCGQWLEKNFKPACEAALEGYKKSVEAKGGSCD